MEAKPLIIKTTKGYDKDGNEIITPFPSQTDTAVITSYTNDKKRMGGAPTITATFYYKYPLDKMWTYEEFVELEGERYYITSMPSSSKDNSSILFKHEITFTSRREILDNTLFFDVVSLKSDDTFGDDKYRSNQTTFSFGGDIFEFVQRINDCLVYCGLYNENKKQGYKVVVDEGYGTNDVKEVSFDDQYITEVLQLINTTFELDYYWCGTVCHVGKMQQGCDFSESSEYGDKYVAKYGRNNALLSISKENANYKIIDMITGRGASDNLPYYYPNHDEFGEAIFNTKNISKDIIEISLSKLQKAVGPEYQQEYTLCKRTGEITGIIDDFTYMNTLPSADVVVTDGGNITRLIMIPITGKVGMKIHQPQVSADHFCDEGVIIENDTFSWTINGKEFNKSYTIEEDGEYTLMLWENISVKSPIGTFTADKYIHYAYSGGIKVDYEKDSTFFWRFGDNIVEYEDSGIYVNNIDSTHPKESIVSFGVITGKGYGFSETINQDTEVNAPKIQITGRKWIYPSQSLMPSVYRKSNGGERFYYATNNPDDDVKELYVSGETGDLYHFNNEFTKGRPHQGSVSFDDIKPTIRNIRNDVIQEDGKGQLFGEIEDVAFDKEDSDIKNDSGEYIHSYFYIKLHKFSGAYGFDLFKQILADESVKIEMIKSNGCPACSFEIGCYWTADGNKCYNNVLTDGHGNLKAEGGKMGTSGDYILTDDAAKSSTVNQDTTKEELWVCVKKDTSTMNMVMPNANLGWKPQKGDLFVLTGINPPQVLITEAENRLDKALIKHMNENNEDQFNYSIKFSRVYLQENPIFASHLNENSKLTIEFDGTRHDVFVSNYTVKVENDILASVEVELVNTLDITTSDTKQIIDAVKGDVIKQSDANANGGNSNFNASFADKLYVSKTHDDYADGNLTLGKNLVVNGSIDTAVAIVKRWMRTPSFVNGVQGWAAWTDDDGLTNIEVDRLTVRQVMNIFEMLINKIRSVGGQICVSAANGKIKTIEEIDNQYRITFETETGYIENDLLRCQTFTGGHLKGYWVEAVKTDDSGQTVWVNKADFADGYTPEIGDETVLMGNTTNVKRQNLVLLSATEDGQPRIDVMNGIKACNTDRTLRARLGNLDGIKDNWFPFDNQPHGDGLYADNAYLKGTFLLSTGEDVKTRFEVTEGKINTAIDGLRQELSDDKSYLGNPTFSNGMEKWLTQNDAVFFLVGNRWVWANNAPLSKKGDGAMVVTDMGRTTVHIIKRYIMQRNRDLHHLPEFPTDNDGKKQAIPVYLSFYYRCAKEGTLRISFENVDKTGFADFDSMDVTETIAVTEGYTQFTCNGLWNGTGDFKLAFGGEIYLYMLVLSTDKVEALAYKYKTLFEQSEKLVKIAAQNFDKDGHVLNESGIMVRAEGAGIYTQDADGNLATVGTFENGVIKLTGNEIQLEGDVTANGRFHIGTDGSVTMNNAHLNGFIMHVPTEVTDQNIESYTKTTDFGTELDFSKAVSMYTFNVATGNLILYLPSLGRGENLTEEEKESIRSMIGNKILIYNKGTASIGISGGTRKKGENTFSSSSINTGMFFSLTCCVDITDDGKELIYWEYVRGTKN